ncbi:MAG TPA: HIT family hydrolase [Elusimicrobia bacterium]|jgi:ATP adenylyltransferase|nr:HIT family hydrolase [Elusimicrobiota bacterium]
MKVIWAPWRMKFIKEWRKKKPNCIFCEKCEQKNDQKNLLLYRGKKSFILLNLYPYNNGHLMVAPYRHKPDFNDLTKEELTNLLETARLGVNLLKKTLNPEGFNLGINLGKIAGAGIKDHLHIHIVPRWAADTNFMPICGETKVIPESLTATYKKLKKTLSREMKKR